MWMPVGFRMKKQKSVPIYLRLNPEIVFTIVNSRYLKVKADPKLLISQSQFSGPRKFSLGYQ